MARIARLSRLKEPGAPAEPSSQAIVDEVRSLLSRLPASEQQRAMRELTAALCPISAPQAGEVLGTIVQLLPRRQNWNVTELKEQVAAAGVQATAKEVYNALGYLTRKGHIRRVGYGRYVVGGAGIVTSDDLGGEPARDEND